MSTAEYSWVVGIVISVLLAALTFALEQSSSGNRSKKGALSSALNTALLGVILTALVSHNIETRSTLDQAIPKMKLQTWQTIVGDIETLDQDLSRSEGYGRIHEITMEPLRQLLSSSIAEAKQGVIKTKSVAQTVTLATDLMQEARQRILVTSYISPSEWWTTQVGTQYSELTKSTPTRVDIFERIFIVDDEDELKALRPLMLRQKAENVKVRFAMSSAVGPEFRRDFIVIDDLVAGEMLLDDNRRFQEGRFYTNKTNAQDFAQRFRQIAVWSQEP